ncbi:ribokinase [Bacillus sp. DTU_2020_1000418_1_SI_GHA_SEK_038]|uniref:ribokinase n=1 Tax=Bacillus sp. DTU_2020_1000418_1_SI_GHA_SEK_038 TaxID=3077585 RepID=UPI0028E361B8|nr:ribokinase [Bacillus sp. DTU_2020_1000418_1_SI_GHA_SEK_038]WNS73633.1 ribokinase [Bacillus sp. DTU_2020_1000418_1_SI_GHA_SEK_038]
MAIEPKITVVGSINMDLVTITDQIPQIGETLLGNRFQTNPGGKGANQAVAAARLGANVNMIGCVGNDTFGKELLQHLNDEGVDVSNVEPVTGSTGTATIIVSNQDNSIIVVPAANEHVTAAFVESKRDVIAASDILILQLEIPLEGVLKAVEIAKENGVKVILNPAPIQELPTDLIEKIDYLTPNEHEFKELVNGMDEKVLKEKVILTKGSQGVSFYLDEKEVNIPAFQVNVVDTTGAGDSFNAGFAVALSKGLTLNAACKYGNAVAALSTTKLGAQTGMPTEIEVNDFIKTNE